MKPAKFTPVVVAPVTFETVRERLSYLEGLNAKGAGTAVKSQQFEIACLRELLVRMESRTVTVKLPQRLQPGADGWDDWYVHSDDEGEYLKFDDVLAMLTVAGIKVEAE